MATGGEPKKVSPVKAFFRELLSGDVSTGSPNVFRKSLPDLKQSTGETLSESGDRPESGDQSRRGSTPDLKTVEMNKMNPSNVTDFASGVIKETGTKKKVIFPAVVPAADAFDLDELDLDNSTLQECLSDEEDLNSQISVDLKLLDPEDNDAELHTLAAIFPKVLIKPNELTKDPEPNPDRITELTGLTDPEGIEMYIQYYKDLCRHRRKIYNHGRLIKGKLLTKQYHQVELDDLLYYTENSKTLLDLVHNKLVNMYDLSSGQKRSFTCGTKNLLDAIIYLRAAVDKAKSATFELHATQQNAAQHTAPALIGTTPQVSTSILTESGNARTGYWPGTGNSGSEGESGGPPNEDGNSHFRPSTNNSSETLATIVKGFTDAISNNKSQEDDKPNYHGLEKPRLDIFSGDASVYAFWKKKFLLHYNPERNLPNAYLANALHGILQGEARQIVEAHFTADWNGDDYPRMWEQLDLVYGSRHTQDRCIQDKAAQIPLLDSETLKSFGIFYRGITVQVYYYLERQPPAVTMDNSHLYQQMRQKISDELFMKFAEWSLQHIPEEQPRRSLMALQKWLLHRMEILREVETFSTSAKFRSSRSPPRSKQTGSYDPVEDESDSDTDPNHTVILTYASGKKVRYNRKKDKYYRYKPFPAKELSHHASNCASTNTNAVILQTLVCNLSGRKGRKGSKTVAFLDPGSTQTFVSKDMAIKLKLKRTSKTQAMTVTVFNQQVTIDSYRVELYLASIDGSKTVTITAYVVQDLVKQLPIVDWSREKDRFSHLKDVPFEPLPSEKAVNLLIGYDHAALLEYSEVRAGTPGQPIARLTPLGWTCSVSPNKI